ncbi:serine/arginine repetitive matrix protein 2, partial [Streptomyces sp. NPDC058953]|uniref:serine/arginine repetitive matrix protein 2 n=1 Tax=Streptomyces sp. NPDC058953 TaxID=3346676 RepID=UPI0036CEFCFA
APRATPPGVPPAPETDPAFRNGGPSGEYGEPPGPGGARLAPAVVVSIAALVAMGVAATLWFTVGPGDDDAKPSTKTSSSAEASSSDGVNGANGALDPSTPATDGSYSPSGEPSEDQSDPSASPSGTESSGTTTVPAGFRVTDDPEGFTIAVPEYWARTTVGASVFYTSPDDTALIQVFRITEPDYTPLDAVEFANQDLAGRTKNYQERAVGRVASGMENPTSDAAELAYAYDSADAGGRRQCVERVFTATDYTIYAVLTCAPAEQSPLERTVLETALDHFDP